MRNEVVSIEVPNVGTINVSARMKGECKGTQLFSLISGPGIIGKQMFNAMHYKYTLCIWSEHGKMFVTYHDFSDNWSKGIKKLGRLDLLNALDRILSDISVYYYEELEDCFDPIDERFLMKRAERDCELKTGKFINVVGGKEYLEDAIAFLLNYIYCCPPKLFREEKKG